MFHALSVEKIQNEGRAQKFRRKRSGKVYT